MKCVYHNKLIRRWYNWKKKALSVGTFVAYLTKQICIVLFPYQIGDSDGKLLIRLPEFCPAGCSKIEKKTITQIVGLWLIANQT